MSILNISNSEMEKWLRKKHMATTTFARIIGCSRPVIHKVKQNQPICSEYAKKIIEETNGEVTPILESRGKNKQL